MGHPYAVTADVFSNFNFPDALTESQRCVGCKKCGSRDGFGWGKWGTWEKLPEEEFGLKDVYLFTKYK